MMTAFGPLVAMIPAQRRVPGVLLFLSLLLSGAAAHAAVELPTGYYHESTDDLVVKVLGGHVRLKRTWYEGEWHFTRAWNALSFEYDALDGSVKRIERNRDVYARSANDPDLFFFDARLTVRKTAEGYRWADREGNWIDYDASGRVVRYGERNGVSVRLAYDEQGRRSGVFDHHGRQVLWYAYDGEGRLSAVHDASTPSARRVEYHYSDGRLDEVIDVLGKSWRYAYDGAGRLTRSLDPEGRPTHLAYDSVGRVVSVTGADGSGRFYRYAYDKTRKQYYTQSRTSAGRVEEQWYDRDGEVVRREVNGERVLTVEIGARRRVFTDALGRQTVREYDDWDNLLAVTYPDGTSERYRVSPADSNRLERIDARGIRTRYDYDAHGNRIRETAALGTPLERVTEYTYDAYGQVSERRRLGDGVSDEAITRYTYDTAGNLLTMTDPEEHTLTYLAYEALGNALAWRDARDAPWSAAYDARGQVLAVTDPLAHTTRYEYDGAGNRIARIAPGERTTRYRFDENDRLVEVTDAAGGITRRAYDAAGRLIRVTDPEGKWRSLTYDAQGRLASVTDGAGDASQYRYGERAQGATPEQLSAIVYPTYTVSYHYDARGRRSAVTEAGEGTSRTTRYAYDEAGNRRARTDAEERTTGYAYDALGRLASVTEPAGQRVDYAYDARDNLLSVRNENGVVIRRYAYDRNDRLLEARWPGDESTRYAYDPNGNLSEETDARGQLTRYTYDAANRLTLIRYFPDAEASAPSKQVTLQYDARDQLIAWDDGTFSGTLSYDALGRKSAEHLDYGPFSRGYAYDYDKNGQKRSLTGPAGQLTRYTYDAANRLATVQLPGGGTLTVNRYRWRALAALTFPGGTTRQVEHDAFLRPREIRVNDPAGNPLLDYRYTYDASDNITEKATEHGVYTYGYDARERLITLENPTLADEAYAYDGAGNRLSAAHTEGPWEYNAANQLESYPGTSYHYDANGNTTEKTEAGLTTRYSYDAEDRLSEVRDESGNLLARYAYDPFGRRLAKTRDGTTTYFLYADEGLIAELDAAGNLQQAYGWAPDSPWGTEPLYTETNGERGFYLTDHLGTPHKLIAPNGATLWAATYQAFGQAQVDAASRLANPLRFPGQYFDPETGLHYNYFRDYDPNTGRYIESDPIGLDGGLNTYAYAGGNPITSFDPSGLWFLVDDVFTGPVDEILVIAALYAAWQAANQSHDSSSDAGYSDAAQRQSEYQRMKDRCDKKPQRTGNRCSDLSREIDHYENCAAWYERWDSKWQPGRHATKIQNWRNRVHNLKQQYDRECAGKKCP